MRRPRNINKDEVRNALVNEIVEFYGNNKPIFSGEGDGIKATYENQENLDGLSHKLNEYDRIHYPEFYQQCQEPFENNPYFRDMNGSTIYHVHFHEPKKGKKDYYFGSLSALFDHFSKDEIGVALQTLYNEKLNFGTEYKTAECVIRKEQLIRKPKTN